MTKYFAVAYCTDETIHLWPGDTQEECLATLKKVKEKVGSRLKCTTVIKRDMDNFKEGLIFGNPKSLNVCANK